MRKLSSLRRLLPLLPLAAFTTAWAQPAPAPAPDAAAAQEEELEEIIVRGRRSLLDLRREADLALERVFDAFNANNSDDDLDIYCSDERRTGRRVSSRVCSPVYADKATAQAGKDFARRLLYDCGSPPGICEKGTFNGAAEAQRSIGTINRMNKVLEAEMQRLARENREVAQAIVEFDARERAYHEELDRRRE